MILIEITQRGASARWMRVLAHAQQRALGTYSNWLSGRGSLQRRIATARQAPMADARQPLSFTGGLAACDGTTTRNVLEN